MPGDLEMSGLFHLGLIRLDVHMTAQRVPIQLAGPLRAGTLICHPAGLEPPVDAGLAYLESPSRHSLAATTSNKIHHSLTQILMSIAGPMLTNIHHQCPSTTTLPLTFRAKVSSSIGVY